MQKSINFFHNDNKILSAFDNVFFVKTSEGWSSINNKKVFKGNSIPDNNLGDDGDYYINYNEIDNLLESSELFNKNGWEARNVSLINSTRFKVPYSYCQKMSPNKNNSEHYISYKWISTKTSQNWCFSIYVLPQEFNNFQITLSNHNESYGIKAIFSRRLINRKYHMEVRYETFGNIPTNDMTNINTNYEIVNINSENISEIFYRVFLSCKVNVTEDLKIKFSILDNNFNEKFINNADGTGLFINAAQLTNTNLPTEYILSDGSPFSYQKISEIYLKDTRWTKLSKYNTIYYSNDEPQRNLGNVGDLYFQNPIIELGKIVRFGKNTLYHCWKNNDKNYYTVNEKPLNNEDVYEYENDTKNIVGKVISSGKDNVGSYINIEINNQNIKAYRNNSYDNRFVKIPGVIFWNREEETYSYINNNNQVCNLKYSDSSLYNFKLVIDAISFSTNLFMQTWDTKYTVQPRSFEYGFNTGGHGNFLDYNRLRFYY